MFLLDTNVISELRKTGSGRENKNVVTWANSVSAGDMYLSVITVLELEQGILLLRRKDAVAAGYLRKWMDTHVLPAFNGRIIAVDVPVALKCAVLHVPNPCAERDCLIAATALVHGMTVVTRNVDDFKNTGASIINPWQDVVD